MDIFEPNRNQLIHDLELVLEWAQSRAKDRAVGQGNLFDMLGGDSGSSKGANGFESAPKAAPVADFPPQEKLKLEKELLGFYISDHPLKSIQQAAKVLAPINLGDLADQSDSILLSAIVMINGIKPIITKKGDRMAILQLEDLTGQAEAVVFPKSYERIHQHLQVDQRLMLWGKADRRDDRVQFIIEDAEPIEAVWTVMVELEAHTARDITKQHFLRTVLLEHRGKDESGKIPVVAVVSGRDRREMVRLGPQFRVQDDQTAVNALVQAGFQARASLLAAN
jgi:DNA polymerase-3 subunit alpha